VENVSERRCFFCGEPTDTYVRDEVNGTKVPICEKCFMEIYPSKRNKAKIYFWMVIFPIVTEER